MLTLCSDAATVDPESSHFIKADITQRKSVDKLRAHLPLFSVIICYDFLHKVKQDDTTFHLLSTTLRAQRLQQCRKVSGKIS